VLGQQQLKGPLDNMGNFREVHEYPLLEGGIERMRELLSDCVDFHPQCRPPSETCLPQRVIDIGPTGNDARLYISQGEKQAYAALSHCWGSAQFLTTTKATFLARQRGIDWQDLPKTFQDAIEVCRTIDIRYIWIDSLCIIQDNRYCGSTSHSYP
jgi:Heterokaryon incompatibility protein (HET)